MRLNKKKRSIEQVEEQVKMITAKKEEGRKRWTADLAAAEAQLEAHPLYVAVTKMQDLLDKILREVESRAGGASMLFVQQLSHVLTLPPWPVHRPKWGL